MSTRMNGLASAWQSTKVVRTREKISFFCGVMSVVATALLFGMAPEWIHVSFTLQALYFFPMRFYTYKKKQWHYFLFDLCYYANILSLLYIWVFPGSASLFVACYCLAHGASRLFRVILDALGAECLSSPFYSFRLTRQRSNHVAEQSCLS
jgi:hypothetical protein